MSENSFKICLGGFYTKAQRGLGYKLPDVSFLNGYFGAENQLLCAPSAGVTNQGSGISCDSPDLSYSQKKVPFSSQTALSIIAQLYTLCPVLRKHSLRDTQNNAFIDNC